MIAVAALIVAAAIVFHGLCTLARGSDELTAAARDVLSVPTRRVRRKPDPDERAPTIGL